MGEKEIEKGDSSSGDSARPWQSYHTAYTNAKAGMDGVDKEKVQRIVYEMSKGSKYFENEQRKEAFTGQKIESMRLQRAKLTAADISHYQTMANKRISELEGTRNLSRIWLHVDMDVFYAAVETLSNPLLKGKPMAVGSMSMISTANYEARRFGVCAAMPGFIARKLCPELIFVPTDFKKYTYFSDLTRKVFHKYDPNFMATSLDEAFLDITDICKERGINSGEIAEELRTTVYEETGLTCSAGVGPNRLLAKVCSDINKPNGQFVLPNERMAVMTFISSLPIRKIGGIGKVTEHILRDVFGINTCEDMLQKGGFVCALFSHSTAEFFLSVGLGLGKTDTPQVKLRKSISNERTFAATGDEALLHQKLCDLADMLSADMQKEGLSGRTLTLKLKTSSFEVRTRAMTLQQYICSSEDILKYASNLLKAELPVSLRLIGLRLSQFNEDKVGAPSDTTQKTLTDFLLSRDTSRKLVGRNGSLGAIIDDHRFMNDTETGFPIDSYEIYGYNGRDLLDSNHLPYLNDNNHAISNKAGEMGKMHEPLNNETENETNLPEPKSHKNAVSELLEADSSSVQVTCTSLDEENKRANLLDDEAVSTSNQSELLMWVNDYKCSLCGIELPPSFVEERQEHFDFHLAERLQKEESLYDTRTIKQRHRFSQKDNVASQSKHKKQKTCPKDKGLIPIDVFFVKSNKNF
ncbi:DNA polymerase kappa [Juglans microcarpa x Juglans regia]|uniref:DNA polymerase kappa n=1 Tax=Juglans microcarpa x Juglans regia TaxID=2249226 RepID=UPI001B7F3109|nr:DNA polymerase kappa [Juglans microcarpa x Juglans regia]